MFHFCFYLSFTKKISLFCVKSGHRKLSNDFRFGSSKSVVIRSSFVRGQKMKVYWLLVWSALRSLESKKKKSFPSFSLSNWLHKKKNERTNERNFESKKSRKVRWEKKRKKGRTFFKTHVFVGVEKATHVWWSKHFWFCPFKQVLPPSLSGSNLMFLLHTLAVSYYGL